MARRKQIHEINMMLHKRYVENWTVKHALRELYANCIDADEACLVEFPTEDQVEFITESHPSLTDMILMGAGNKDAKTGTIGQFGEGAKLAALVLTRGRHNLVIQCPAGEITFKFKKVPLLDTATLHAVVDPNEAISGFRATFRAAKVEEIFSRYFLPFGTMYGALQKGKNAQGMKIFHRGIHVTTEKEPSLFDYNLERLKLNRDRTIPESYDLRYRVAEVVQGMLIDGDTRLADNLIKRPEVFEIRALDAIFVDDTAKQMLAARFRDQFGDKAVLSSGQERNQLAAGRGHTVVPLAANISTLLKEGGVDRASDVLLKSDSLIPIDKSPYQADLDEVRLLLDIIGVGAVEIFVFEDDGDHLGCFDRHGVWLAQSLFAAGNRFERIRTLLHEIGHQKGGGDATITFESSLDFVAAKLGQYLLDHRG